MRVPYSFLVSIFAGLLMVVAFNANNIRRDLTKLRSAVENQTSVEDRYNSVVEVVGKYSGADSSGVVRPDSFIVKDEGKLKIVQVREKLVSLESVPKYMRKTYDSNNNPVYTPILAELTPPGK